MEIESVSENEIFGYEEDIFGKGADKRRIAFDAGCKGFGRHNRKYDTTRLSRILTWKVADILAETGKVEMYDNRGKIPRRKPYDLYWTKGDKRLRVKHLFSIQTSRNPGLFYYEYRINYYRGGFLPGPDIYILTAYDQDIYPIHFWIINTDEKIQTQRSSDTFHEKNSFSIYETERGISKMKRYEDNDKLLKLREIMKERFDVLRCVRKID